MIHIQRIITTKRHVRHKHDLTSEVTYSLMRIAAAENKHQIRR